MPFGLNFERISAIIERDMRKFFRSPALMVSSMVFPLMQLIVLGYAFGGKIKGTTSGLVDEDGSRQSRIVRERFNAIAAGPQTFHTVEYDSLPNAVLDLRAGFVRAVVHIPHDYSRRVLHQDRPRIAFIEDNTHNFVSSGFLDPVQHIHAALNPPLHN